MKPEKIYVVFKNDALPFIDEKFIKLITFDKELAEKKAKEFNDETNMFYYTVKEIMLDAELDV